MSRIVIVLLAMSAGIGCQLLGPDITGTPRTLPHALDLPVTTLSKALHDVTLPDSVNARAYVTGRNICPPNALCIIADGISLAESESDADPETIHIAIGDPQQFVVDRRYTFSFQRSSPHTADGITTYALRILAYD